MLLTELFDQYGSDKGTHGDGHLYSASYEHLIPRSTERLVEIGIGTYLNFNGSCGSIFAWLEWIDGEVIGFDINAPTAEIKSDRFTFVQGDQGDRADLERLAAAVGEGSCDAIIDDGSHLSNHQTLALEVLWPCVKPGGIYVIEDTHLRWGLPPYAADILADDERFERHIGTNGHGIVLRKTI